MQHAPLTIAIALTLVACNSNPASGGPVAGTATPAAAAAGKSDPKFCAALQQLIDAADGDFASLRTGEPSKMMPSWESKVALPGSSTCRVADKDSVSFGSVFCVMSESADKAAIAAAQTATTDQVTACLTGWKSGTGEQLGTQWLEFEPATQKSSSRSLQVYVRLTEPVENARGSVTIDVAVKRPGAKPVTSPE